MNSNRIDLWRDPLSMRGRPTSFDEFEYGKIKSKSCWTHKYLALVSVRLYWTRANIPPLIFDTQGRRFWMRSRSITSFRTSWRAIKTQSKRRMSRMIRKSILKSVFTMYVAMDRWQRGVVEQKRYGLWNKEKFCRSIATGICFLVSLKEFIVFIGKWEKHQYHKYKDERWMWRYHHPTHKSEFSRRIHVVFSFFFCQLMYQPICNKITEFCFFL